MKKLLIAFCFFFNFTVYGQVVIFDFNTGVSNTTGSMINYGDFDDTWLVSKPGKDGFPKRAYVCSNLWGSWDDDQCGRWITPELAPNGIDASIDNNVGKFQYVARFSTFYPIECVEWIKVNFVRIGGDNSISRIKFNGNTYLVPLPNYDDHNPLYENVTIDVLASDFRDGGNELIIEVHNREAYTGFFACGNVTVTHCR